LPLCRPVKPNPPCPLFNFVSFVERCPMFPKAAAAVFLRGIELISFLRRQSQIKQGPRLTKERYRRVRRDRRGTQRERMSRYFYRENRTPQPSAGPLCTPRTLRLACLVFSKVPHQQFILV
jgi:hypothetical protein